MAFSTVLRLSLGALSLSFLVACGGGGSSSTSGVQTAVASTLVIPKQVCPDSITSVVQTLVGFPEKGSAFTAENIAGA